ncbi:MAG: hypothetical protein GY875_03785 [Gammaproteobacteria bacterium]|nr:hypothetical protein [Gammaproteobacteria bacterium]
MKQNISTAQAGYALLLMVLALMGIGGVVLTGFTQGVKVQSEHERYLYNQRVLAEAKQVLLQYAFSYPVTAGNGPGRLPCPDIDDDGIPNATAFCGGANGIVGRFPWYEPEMSFYDARDASGERLWYAVSNQFANSGLLTINSATLGTINIEDRSGARIHDATAGGGVAAVIIAPGSAIDRAGAVQDRIADSNDPENYLDLFGAVDNADFVNLTADGFVTGPIKDVVSGDILVNDQMIVITAAEVIAMAEKATLQTYQRAINDYRANILVDAYPWLDDYATQITVLNDYDGDVGTRLGRLPSIFSNYFAPSPQNSQTITSDVEMRATPMVNGFPVPPPPLNPIISANAAIQFGNNGDLIITPSVNGASITLYYWDERIGADGWQQCLPVVNGDERDCNQALAAPGVPNGLIGTNELATRVVRVTYTNNLVATEPFTRSFADSAGLDPQYQAPTAVAHAKVLLTYSEAIADAIGVDFKYDSFYLIGFDDVLLGSVDYQLGVNYYPELPDWPLTDGWHDSIQMSYAAGFQPGAAADCVAPNCITVANIGGIPNNKVAVLVLASDHNFVDDDNDGFDDELADIFELENDDNDDQYDARSGNDRVLVIR